MWRGGVGLLASVLTAGLALVLALLLGFNSPRPMRSPDWQAAGLPIPLEAAPNATSVRLLGRSYDDFTVEVEAVPLSGPDSGFDGYGLVYRAQDDARYYAFAVGSDGYYAVLRIDGDEEVALVDWQQFPHVHRGMQPNRLRAACSGATCHFYINEKEPVRVQFESARVWVE
jgi:hypothetical protein